MENKGVVFQAINLMDRYYNMMGTRGLKILLEEEFKMSFEAKIIKKFVSFFQKNDRFSFLAE